MISERLIVDPETQGVRNALVYLIKPTAIRDAARRAVPKKLRLSADRGVFTPHVLASMQGSEIFVSTKDPIVYNIHARIPIASAIVPSFATPRGNAPAPETGVQRSNELNALFGGVFRDGRRTMITVTPLASDFPIPVQDDVHPWMLAWWLVLDHPYFAVTDGQGRFTIHDVPTGPQQVIVWQEALDATATSPHSTRKWVFRGEVLFLKDVPTEKTFIIEPGQIP
jgi:hypothetical protein